MPEIYFKDRFSITVLCHGADCNGSYYKYSSFPQLWGSGGCCWRRLFAAFQMAKHEYLVEPVLCHSIVICLLKLSTLKAMIHFRSQSYDSLMCNQLLWETTGISLSVNWSCNAGFRFSLLSWFRIWTRTEQVWNLHLHDESLDNDVITFGCHYNRLYIMQS